ncbi:ABC transporter permease [Paenibacillus fonticola]|uniref:ABC transporter permease n=1 Tax=Paenibacillus fonticola TaxID=379896 RepID=UPI00036E3113|nr:ABC transporter permease [Paenibacillus fonticola]
MTTESSIAPAALHELPPQTSSTHRFFRVLLARKIVVIALFILIATILVAIFAPLFAPYNPYKQDLSNSLVQPSSTHLLGTDMLGRDVLSRIIFGTRISLIVGFVVVIIAGVLGMSIGLVSGYFGGWLDSVLMRFMDAVIAIPMIVLAMAIGAVLGGGIVNVIIALGVAIVPAYARLMRGQVLSVKQADFVIAGTLTGISNLRNMLVHVLPNCISPLIVLITMNLGMAILAEAGLSFLGLGIVPPGASWGSMVNDGYRYLLTNPVLSLAPGVAIVIVVLAFNIVGDAIRDALDPRLRGTE